MNKKFATTIACVAIVVAASTVSARAESKLSVPVTLSDGTVATPYDRCGASDMCGEVKYPNGDDLVIYSEGASKFHPYHLHFTVLRKGTIAVVEYDDTTETEAERKSGREFDLVATYVMDRGKLRLDFYTNKDGTLKPRFTVGAASADDSDEGGPIPQAK